MRSTRRVDARADIWALGTMFHELLTGRPPFVASTMPELCAMIVADPAPPLRASRPDAPPELEAAILRCLEKEPDKRFASVAEMAAELAPFGTAIAVASAERIAKVVPSSLPRWDSSSHPRLVRLSPSSSQQRAVFVSPSSSQERSAMPISSPGGAPLSSPGVAPISSPAVPPNSVRLVPPRHTHAISAPEQLTRTSKAWGGTEPPVHPSTPGIDRLIQLALERHQQKTRTRFTYEPRLPE